MINVCQSISRNTLCRLLCKAAHFDRLSSGRLPRKSKFNLEIYEITPVRLFSSTSSRQIPVIPPIAIKAVGLPIAAFIGRRVRRKWLSIDSQHHILATYKNQLLGVVVAVVVSSVAFFVFHLEKTPVTDRKRFIMFNIDQFEPLIEMEKDMLFHVLKGSLLPVDHTAYKTVQKVITQILKENPNAPNVKQRKWRISVVDSEQQNAFVMPTGHIFVFSGILEIAKNENQLAVVLGHELSHALLDHVVELHSLQFCTEIGALAFATWLWAVIASKWVAFLATVLMYKAIKVAFLLPRHRLLEREADTVGLDLTAKACYDVRENSIFWTRMQLMGAISDKSKEHSIGDTMTTILSYLSTHPSHEERANLLEAATPKALELRQKCNCPPLTTSEPSSEIGKLRQLLAKAKSARHAPDKSKNDWEPYVWDVNISASAKPS